MVNVIKKDGRKEPFKIVNIEVAIDKSAERANYRFTKEEKKKITDFVTEQVESLCKEDVPVEFIHNTVEAALKNVAPTVADCYISYHNWRKQLAKMMDEAYMYSRELAYMDTQKENANKDGAITSTKQALLRSFVSKQFYNLYFKTANEVKDTKEGYYYIHDEDGRLYSMNCCLCDWTAILKNGFEMANQHYNEPKSIDTAFDVIGDLVLSAASQQYGGFTLPQIDEGLAEYAEKTEEKYYVQFIEMGVTEDVARVKSEEWTIRDIKQGYQGWEYKFNTVASSRGDYPFITISLGLATSKWGREIAKAILEVHKEGQGEKGKKRAVLFPKIVFLYDKELCHGINRDVYDAGIECSRWTMYPDWLSLTGEGYISDIYKKYRLAISPMGCVDGKEVITYKYNGKLYIESFERLWRLLERSAVPQRFEGDINLYVDTANINLEIWDTEKGFVKVSKLIRNVSDKWVDVTLSNGRTLLCTANHPFETQNRGVVHAEDLTSEDTVLINSSQYSEETKVVDNDYAWMLGVLLCDSCYDEHITTSIALTGEDEIEDRLRLAFDRYYHMELETVERHRAEKGSYKDLKARTTNYSSSLHSLSFELECLFGGIKKIHRHIPNEVFRWNYEAKMAFLAGMIDADGYINSSEKLGQNSVVQIGSTNKELALQQLALAQALGMPAKIYKNHYSPSDISKIRYRIEFPCSEELASYISCQKKAEKCRYNESYVSFNTFARVSRVEIVDKKDFSYDVSTESEHFEVSGIYSHNCRAFLSPWYRRGGMHPADENDEPVFIGRFNIGAVSLNLPMIYQHSIELGTDFFMILDEYLEDIRNLHKRTYKYLSKMKAGTNPLMCCQGGFYNPDTDGPAHLEPHESIEPLLKCATASFGITALNELQRLYNGKSIYEDGNFALLTLQHINEKVNEFKEEDHILYAIYGTPAESLCAKQPVQFRNKYGIIKNVSDREYFSNSFHCHVSEQITPIQKQDSEKRFWELSNGGKIQYVKYPSRDNVQAFYTLVERAMDMGFYEGVNLDLNYCDDCGYESLDIEDECPHCGGHNITKINRMNGYLAFSRVHGDTRLNAGKMAEIHDRVSM